MKKKVLKSHVEHLAEVGGLSFTKKILGVDKPHNCPHCGREVPNKKQEEKQTDYKDEYFYEG